MRSRKEENHVRKQLTLEQCNRPRAHAFGCAPLVRDLMLESMAEYFTVGELLALARFYSGDGGTVVSKFADYITGALPNILRSFRVKFPRSK
jgi:hypothetical protein